MTGIRHTRALLRLAFLTATLLGTITTNAAPLPLLRVSDNHRYLVTADDKPFFWLGDTAWELFHRLDREEAEHYLRTRAAQGYSVVLAVVLAEQDGLRVPNPYGAVPLRDNDPSKPNETYFEHIDWILACAETHGIYIAMLPAWGDKWNHGRGFGPEILTPENAETYGEWLARRYAGKNIIWVIGGDRHVENDKHREINRAMARGLRRGDGGKHLITFHPQGNRGSAEYFHDEPWLDFNMRQNGHAITYTNRYSKTLDDYNRIPVKPIIDGEPCYEDHPIDFKATDNGHSTASDVRRPLYWNLFNGAFGHTYGHHSVWQMYNPAKNTGKNAPLMPWREALAQPGAQQMQHARWLFESRPFLTRIPAADIIVPDPVPTAVPGAGRYHFTATRDTEGRYAMIYAPVERRFTVKLDWAKTAVIRAWWYNPRNGEAIPAGEFSANGEKNFIPPDPGSGLDWILVLDNAAENYPAPGTRRTPAP